MPKRYRVQRNKYNDYFIISLSTTEKLMQKDLGKFTQEKKAKAMDMEGLAGAVVPVDKEDSLGRKLFAVCFLNEEDISFDVISHECLHLAFAHERGRNKFNMQYDTYEDEERICYLFDDIFDAVMKLLKAEGHIKGNIWKKGKDE